MLDRKFKIAISLCLAICIVSSIALFLYYDRIESTQLELEKLASFVDLQRQKEQNSEINDFSKNVSMSRETEKAIILPQYSVLYMQNNHLYGWIRIEGTNIDYPVMFTPEDSEYYLHRDFNGAYSFSGLPFIDGYCDTEKSLNFIIYSHNMKDGTMFSDLTKYVKKSFWEKHRYVYFDTLYAEQIYEIIAIFRTKVFSANEDQFRYYSYVNINDQSTFDEYVTNVKTLSLYDTQTTAKYGEHLITLSTCSYHTKNGRFVVVAKRIEQK